MLESTHGALLEVLEYIGTLVRDKVAPARACGGLEELRVRHPQASIELVWEAQQLDQSLHYDALIRGSEAMTVSLSVCPDGALAWPLRGVQRSSDSDLLRVNGVVLRVADAVARLDVLWQNEALMQSLIDGCLIEDALRAQAIEVRAEEVQTALDAIRRRRGLYSAADTRAWMSSTGATEHTLELLATDVARGTKLRDVIVGERAQAHLSQHARDFDILSIAQLQMPSEEMARTAAEAARCGTKDFHQIAEHAFLCGRAAARRPYFQRAWRHRLETPLRRALDDAEPGAVVGPVKLPDGNFLIKLLAVDAAEAGDRPLDAAKTKVFDEWLAERRRTARIEWFWGNKERTKLPDCAIGDLRCPPAPMAEPDA